MKNRLFYIALLVIVLSGCRKHRLKNEKEILVGTWEWVYSDQQFYGRTTTYKIATPKTEETTYQMVFLKKGIVEFYNNNILLEEYRTFFRKANQTNNNFEYYIELDKKPKLYFDIKIREDTLLTYNIFPFDDSDGTWSSINYFIRK